jgi:hypothetical protein
MIMRSSQTLSVLACLALLTGGCSRYPAVSDYEKIRRGQDDFAEFVKSAGGTAELKGHLLGNLQDHGWTVDLTGVTITDELVDRMIEACQEDPVFIMKLGRSTITDEQLDRLDEGKVLQKVFILDLSETPVTDAGLDQLNKVFAITELNLKGTKVTAGAARRLGERKIASPQTPAFLKKQPKVEI